MREFTVGQNDAGQRLDRWLAKTLPLLPAPLAQKYIRLKRVKLNGKGAKRDTRLAEVGDLLAALHQRRVFRHPHPGECVSLRLQASSWILSTRMSNLLLVNKRPGLVVHPDEHERVNTLITHIQAYLYQKKEWSPLLGKFLRPGPVQPHRPEHRRHRHRRQERRGTAGHEPEDPGPGSWTSPTSASSLGTHLPRRGQAGGLSA